MYALFVSLGIVCAGLVAEHLCTRLGKNVETLWGGLFYALLFGVVGARLYHVLDYWQYYQTHISQAVMLPHGGLGILGGLVFGSLGAWLYLNYTSPNQEILPWLDLAAVVLPLGQAIGRWGNYFNNELLPYALYESFLDTVLFGVLWVGYTKSYPKKPGTFALRYICAYSAIRVGLELVKTNYGLTGNTLLWGAVCGIGSLIYSLRFRKHDSIDQ